MSERNTLPVGIIFALEIKALDIVHCGCRFDFYVGCVWFVMSGFQTMADRPRTD